MAKGKTKPGVRSDVLSMTEGGVTTHSVRLWINVKLGTDADGWTPEKAKAVAARLISTLSQELATAINQKEE